MSRIKAFGEGEWVSEKTKELDKLGGIAVERLCLSSSKLHPLVLSHSNARAFRQDTATCEAWRLVENEVAVAAGKACVILLLSYKLCNSHWHACDL